MRQDQLGAGHRKGPLKDDLNEELLTLNVDIPLSTSPTKKSMVTIAYAKPKVYRNYVTLYFSLSSMICRESSTASVQSPKSTKRTACTFESQRTCLRSKLLCCIPALRRQSISASTLCQSSVSVRDVGKVSKKGSCGFFFF